MTPTNITPLDAYRDAVRAQSHAIGRGAADVDAYDDAVEAARVVAAHAGATGEQIDDANDDGFALYCGDLGL